MKKYGFIIFISLVVCILQQALFSRINLFGIGFDFVFVFLICFTLTNSDIDSIFIALLCGLIRDSFFPYIFGVNTVVFLLSTLFIIQVNKRIYKNTIIIPIFLTIFLSAAKTLIYFAYFYISSIRFDFFSKTLNVLLIESVLNSLVSIFVYILVKKLTKFKIMQQEWKF